MIIIILCNKEQTKVLDLCKIFFVWADIFICLTQAASLLQETSEPNKRCILTETL